MTYHFKIFALALLVSGCSVLENKLSHCPDLPLDPPDVIGVDYMCDKPEQLLICEDESLTNCHGCLGDKLVMMHVD